MVVLGNAGKGRPRKRWRDVLEDDLKKGRQDRGLAKDRDRWGAQIMGKSPTSASEKKEMQNEKIERREQAIDLMY